MRYLQPTKMLVFQRYQHSANTSRRSFRTLRLSLLAATASTLGATGYLMYVNRQGEEERRKLIHKIPQTQYGFDLLDKSNEAISQWWSGQKNILTSKIDQAKEHYLPKRKTEETQHLDDRERQGEKADGSKTKQDEGVTAEVVTFQSAHQAIKDALVRYNELYDYLLDTLGSVDGSSSLPPEFARAFEQCTSLLSSESLSDEESNRLKDKIKKLRELVDIDNLASQMKQKFEEIRKVMSDELNVFTSLTSDTGVADSMLLAHAHRKIKQLEARLACEATLHDGRVEAEVMRRLNDRFAEIEDELRRKVAAEEAKKMRRQIDEELKRYGALLEGRHAKNLEEQRKVLQEEMKKEMTKKLLDLTVQFHKEMAELEAGLDTLRAVLNSKMVAEERSKQSQQVWIETSRLAEAALQRTDRLAVLNSLKTLRKLPGRIDLMDKIADMLADQMTQGVLNSSNELIKRFEHVRNVADHVVGIDGQLTLFKYAKAYVLSVWRRITGVPKTVHLSADGFLDLNQLPEDRILAIASGFVASDDLLSAVRMLQLLTGEAHEAVSSWIDDVIRFLTVKQDCDVMLALATSACLSNSPEVI